MEVQFETLINENTWILFNCCPHNESSQGNWLFVLRYLTDQRTGWLRYSNVASNLLPLYSKLIAINSANSLIQSAFICMLFKMLITMQTKQMPMNLAKDFISSCWYFSYSHKTSWISSILFFSGLFDWRIYEKMYVNSYMLLVPCE